MSASIKAPISGSLSFDIKPKLSLPVDVSPRYVMRP